MRFVVQRLQQFFYSLAQQTVVVETFVRRLSHSNRCLAGEDNLEELPSAFALLRLQQ